MESGDGNEPAADFDSIAAAWDELAASNRLCVLIAEDDTGPLGMISFSFNLALRYGGEYSQIEELIVDEAGRGKGLGALLVNEAIDRARKRGCLEMGLYARETTRAFYEKLGFVYVGPEVRMVL